MGLAALTIGPLTMEGQGWVLGIWVPLYIGALLLLKRMGRI